MISIEPVDARGAPDEQGGRTVRASSVCNLILWSSYVVKVQQAAARLGCARAARWPSRASFFWESCTLRGKRELEECLLHRARERACGAPQDLRGGVRGTPPVSHLRGAPLAATELSNAPLASTTCVGRPPATAGLPFHLSTWRYHKRWERCQGSSCPF